ncbi:DUF429 domain-containing protein [Pengzhenrongella frigida]|uniref:DUF429 domain-containing protein n=1 Tax=Pengzhenrongella frigida TaxID=1259133 RepID=A0A4Q5N423_9MICO|nr:DUF429 domain-containing protein [Cellulomonas sp. HLT2-17]RYV52960.1 DUF429 domain-containing protein [Cellulomonas sp. HLT2-17]
MAYIGLDLAWGRNARTGLAALDPAGRLTASGAVRTDDEIAAFVAEHAPGEVVAAIDAPLVVPNLTGRRVCEALVAQEFGRYHAGAYPANRSRPYFDPPRAATLAERFGWDVDPGTTPLSGSSVAIEVYPHPAMVTLFGLATVLPYKAKPGRDVGSLRAAFILLLDHLERTCEDPLQLSRSARWAGLRRAAATAERKSQLGAIEDEVDAILCAYLAWLWGRQDRRMRVLGDVTGGYIVIPGTAQVPPAPAPRMPRIPFPQPGAPPADTGDNQ